jgi:hypothetical protein
MLIHDIIILSILHIHSGDDESESREERREQWPSISEVGGEEKQMK